MSIWHRRPTETLDDAPDDPRVDIPPNPVALIDRPLPPPPVGAVDLITAVRIERIQPRRWVRLRPIREGAAYRIAETEGIALVSPDLASTLEEVFERFARDRGYGPGRPLLIEIARGHEPSSAGHFEGRAADIAAVGGVGFLEWARRWRASLQQASRESDPAAREALLRSERRRNLGLGLYEALQEHGDWRVNAGGWRPYRWVAQLFGPWTPTLGPWKRIRSDEPDAANRQRIADQEWVFRAHRDHIHVAR